MKTALVTGGAGFIGFHLSKHLASQGYEVTILDNFARGKEDTEFSELIKQDNVNFVKGDITLPETFNNLEGEYDYVYHLAAINGTENFYNIPDKVLKVTVLGTINILEWFIQQKKGKILFSSSSEAYAGTLKLMGDDFPLPTPEDVPLSVLDPKNPRWSYGGGKMIGEIAFFAYEKQMQDKEFSIIRYHNIYGPRMGFEHVIPQFMERAVKKEEPFKIFGGEETRTFCHVLDGVKATQLVMESDKTNKEIIHIGRDDDEIKIKELAKQVFELIPDYQPDFDIKEAPKGCVMRRCPNIDKLKSLGYEPSVSLKEGIQDSYDWYKDKF